MSQCVPPAAAAARRYACTVSIGAPPSAPSTAPPASPITSARDECACTSMLTSADTCRRTSNGACATHFTRI